ncbi:hypothetical protein ODZ83_01830 [Acaricomes phytoseiuli]|uniref:four-carbon acid sugar kinase family protein n=1 Tax=Acaricomes phytoseiuli TaxID=291968 RepID=UPI0003A4019D|nr:four-carbon acid sugar kinase family protein [Acaricomes phytoseiuli]MCW1248945.1 hypothetical protein [Acaricomes phytoseiuli]
MARRAELLNGIPEIRQTPASTVSEAFGPGSHRLIVLDDDPTGAQAVAQLPVLTRWQIPDFQWAFAQGGSAIYVLTNTRSLDPAETERINREIVTNALAAAAQDEAPKKKELSFLSRGDSTLRGHFPLETDTIAEVLSQHGQVTDAVILAPAFPAAGRVTIKGVHYFAQVDELTPIAQTEFAQDATFGFSSSALTDYVEEKTDGRIPASAVTIIDVHTIRSEGAQAVAAILKQSSNGQVVVIDALEDADLSTAALGIHQAHRRGKRFLYRTGPTFVRSLIGQAPPEPLSAADAAGLANDRSVRGGLIAVGSHTALTTAQLDRLRTAAPALQVATVELELERILDVAGAEYEAYLAGLAREAAGWLGQGNVIISTSRLVRRGASPEDSLRIAREVSAAMVRLVAGILELVKPRFIIAKGGITSSDIATRALAMHHGWVHGPVLPGTISLWEPRDGIGSEIPYIVFPGNVGDAQALATVTEKLSSSPEPGAGS